MHERAELAYDGASVRVVGGVDVRGCSIKQLTPSGRYLSRERLRQLRGCDAQANEILDYLGVP